MVDITETTFAKTSGSITHGSVKILFEPWGVAESCEIQSEGTATIDLSQTPFELATSYKIGGASPHGQFHLDSSKQHANITGGGFCGHNGPIAWDPFKARSQPQWAIKLARRVSADSKGKTLAVSDESMKDLSLIHI